MTASAVLLGITGSIRWLHFAILQAVLCHYYSPGIRRMFSNQ